MLFIAEKVYRIALLGNGEVSEMPLFSCVIKKKGKPTKKVTVSANDEERVLQLMSDYTTDKRAKVEIIKLEGKG